MKLYTEEQILFYLTMHSSAITRYDLHNIPHIELPSDEEIEIITNDKINLSNDCFGQYDFTSGKQDGFYEGAIWMRDKIQGANK